jgi:HigB_toxin, RelE-like toxic component of a toxin-antitoxin system
MIDPPRYRSGFRDDALADARATAPIPDESEGYCHSSVAQLTLPTTKTLPMHIISRKRLNEFAERHPETKSALAHWYQAAKRIDFLNFANLRGTFPSADQVGKLTVFNIGGNKVR